MTHHLTFTAVSVARAPYHQDHLQVLHRRRHHRPPGTRHTGGPLTHTGGLLSPSPHVRSISSSQGPSLIHLSPISHLLRAISGAFTYLASISRVFRPLFFFYFGTFSLIHLSISVGVLGPGKYPLNLLRLRLSITVCIETTSDFCTAEYSCCKVGCAIFPQR